ncbi:glycosyltransferase family 2 protein [Aquabacterium sp. A7-Y]|uniref:glycosyltransferase family 2 protein n=1 Tax=Aquabacterium sp. A7-Y TaxID=1349605 RepID=UPI00223E1D10|nr:glycosyltransferase family A protein [Aquabacterium sp. A7-Y]MCW7538930.1 glycosyltransferase family 2 protein [Aquabacterium sp. A7-Y]
MLHQAVMRSAFPGWRTLFLFGEARHRRMARMGDCVPALFASKGRDPVVLSLAGMHLEALRVARPETDDRDEALAVARSLCRSGEVLSACLHAARVARRWPDQLHRLVNFAVCASPDAALPLLSAHPAQTAALWYRYGDFPRAAAALQHCSAGEIDHLLLSSAIDRRLGRVQRADEAVERAFLQQGLRPVKLAPAVRGLPEIVCAPHASPCGGAPLVSVVMPVCNVADYIEQAVNSVLQQDHRNLEVIVVDDASTDGTGSRVEAAFSHDPRIQVLRLPVQQGTYTARNRGMAVARGEFITFHDGDDWSHPEKISLQLRAVRSSPRIQASVSDWVRVCREGCFHARQVYPYARMNTSSLMMRRQVLSRLGWFDNVAIGADSEYLARIKLVFGVSAVARVRKVLSLGSWRADSLTNAPATGFSSRHAVHSRLQYWERWNRWHTLMYGEGKFSPLPLQSNIPL